MPSSEDNEQTAKQKLDLHMLASAEKSATKTPRFALQPHTFGLSAASMCRMSVRLICSSSRKRMVCRRNDETQNCTPSFCVQSATQRTGTDHFTSADTATAQFAKTAPTLIRYPMPKPSGTTGPKPKRRSDGLPQLLVEMTLWHRVVHACVACDRNGVTSVRRGTKPKPEARCMLELHRHKRETRR
jgi:hypothetical protein